MWQLVFALCHRLISPQKDEEQPKRVPDQGRSIQSWTWPNIYNNLIGIFKFFFLPMFTYQKLSLEKDIFQAIKNPGF